MGLFGNKKEEEKKPARNAAHNAAGGEDSVKAEDKKVSAPKKEVKKSDSADKTEKVLQQDVDGSLAYKFIVRPWVTEKTHDLMGSGKYVFKIRKEAGKHQVRRAVEKLYNVEVEKVNIVNIHQKKRRFGRIVGKKPGIKKAIVTLKEGNKIEVFE